MTGEPMRVLIVDDEPLARERLRRLLLAEPDVEIAGLCADGEEAVAAITRASPHLVLLDVQMPRCGGLEVVRRIGAANMPLTIFVTAYDSHAIQAFEAGALDYLLKPFDDERFARTMERARAALAAKDAAAFGRRLAAAAAAFARAQAREERKVDRLVVKSGNRVNLIPVEEIDWIGAAGPYAEVHAAERVHVLRMSLAELEERLEERRFQRIHRSTIVNIERVCALQEYFRGEYVVLLKDGTKLKLSRGRRAALEARLGQSL
jgi:two-component system LytT family response regulator